MGSPLSDTASAQEEKNTRIEVKALTVETLDALQSQWCALAGEASEPNPFLEPFMLRPALKALPEGADAQVLLVWRDEKLIGVHAWRRQMRFGRFPVLNIESFRHRHVYFGAPLVASGDEKAFAGAFLSWLDGPCHLAAFASLPLLKADGLVVGALIKVATEQGRELREVECRGRAKISRQGTYEEHLQKNMSSSSRKKMRAKTRRLAALGTIGYDIFDPSKDDIVAWMSGYLHFEHKGWKGEAGTSILSDPNDEIFWREMVASAADQGRLKFSRLKIDDRIIAYSIDVLAGDGAYALKIAHDPAYDCYSPGVLLEYANLKAFFSQNKYDWADSCAASDHSVLSRLWGDEVTITHLAIARRDPLSRLLLKAAMSGASIKAWARRVLFGKTEQLEPQQA